MAAAEPADLIYKFRASQKKRDGAVRVTARGVSWRSTAGDEEIDVPYGRPSGDLARWS